MTPAQSRTPAGVANLTVPYGAVSQKIDHAHQIQKEYDGPCQIADGTQYHGDLASSLVDLMHRTVYVYAGRGSVLVDASSPRGFFASVFQALAPALETVPVSKRNFEANNE